MTPFWETYSWAANPWIREVRTPELVARKYDRIPIMAIRDLRIQRLTSSAFGWQVISIGAESHTRAKISRWMSAIVVASPRIEVGQFIGDTSPITVCRGPNLIYEFS